MDLDRLKEELEEEMNLMEQKRQLEEGRRERRTEKGERRKTKEKEEGERKQRFRFVFPLHFLVQSFSYPILLGAVKQKHNGVQE